MAPAESLSFSSRGIIIFNGYNDSRDRTKRATARSNTRARYTREPRIITTYPAYAMRKIGDDAKEDRPRQPDNHGNNSQECNTCQIKGFGEGKKNRGSPSTSSYIDGRKDAVDHGKAAKKKKRQLTCRRKRMWTFRRQMCVPTFLFFSYVIEKTLLSNIRLLVISYRRWFV